MMSEYRLAVIGNTSVGKSSCTLRYVLGRVDYVDPTIEDTYRKQIVIEDETCIVEVFDSGEGICPMGGPYWQYSDGFICCYAINNRESFESIQNYHFSRILSITHKDRVPLVLIGNKCDLETDRKVFTAEGEQLAKSYGVPFFETSALDNTSVHLAFDSLISEVRKARPPGPPVKGGKKNKRDCKLS